MEKEYLLEQLSPCVREVGLQRKDSWRTHPRRIYDYEFLYCFLGNAHFHIQEREYLLKEGDVVIIPPNVPHTFWVDEQMTGELYWFHCDFEWRPDGQWVYDYYNIPEKYARLFSGELDEPIHIRPILVLKNGWKLPEFISFADNDAVDMIFRTLYKLYSRKDPRFALESKTLCLQLLQNILNACRQFATSAPSGNRVASTIRNYIESNYFRRLSVREMCECTQLNPDYAGKLFKRETGMSLIDCLNQFRIEKAKRLLLDSDLNIADVSEMVGFQNENYFCNVSKKVTGMTPAKLRSYMLAVRDEENSFHE